VRDEEGHPIEGAEVTLWNLQYTNDRGNQWGLGRTDTFLTDAHGKWEWEWECKQVLPKDFSMKPSGTNLECNCVEIKKDGYFGSKTSLSANARIVTLKRTKKITGRVVDENGKPLKDVQVVLSNSQTMPRYGAKTDQDGRFEMSAVPSDEPKKSGMIANLPLSGRQPAWQSLDLSRDVENVELVLKPGATMRLRFDMDKGIAFPNMNFHVTFNREPRIGPSFQNLKPDENGVLLLEGVPAPTPELDVVVSPSPSLGVTRDYSLRYRAEKESYLFKYGDEELRIRIIDTGAYQRRNGNYSFSAGSYGGITTYSE